MKIQVYTAIVGGHDPWRTDIPVHSIDLLGDPLLSARFYKTCPHLLYPEAEWTVWIDGNVFLHVEPEELVQRCIGLYSDYGVFEHAHRSTVVEEAAMIALAQMDTPERIERALSLHDRAETLPLAMTMVLVRHNTERNAQRNAAWWQSICYGSRRDQLSFPLHFPGPYWETVDFVVSNQYFTRVA